MAFECATIGFGDFEGGLLAAAVGNRTAIHQGKKLLDILVIQAQDGRPVERNLLDELEERGANLNDGRIVIQVFAVDVRNHRQDGAELQKRSITFVRFDNQEIALPDARIGAAHGCGFSTHHHCGIEPCYVEHRCGHRRGGSFAMASGNRYSVLQPHQLGQQFAALDDWNQEAARFLNFRIPGIHGRTHHNRLRR